VLITYDGEWGSEGRRWGNVGWIWVLREGMKEGWGRNILVKGDN